MHSHLNLMAADYFSFPRKSSTESLSTTIFKLCPSMWDDLFVLIYSLKNTHYIFCVLLYIQCKPLHNCYCISFFFPLWRFDPTVFVILMFFGFFYRYHCLCAYMKKTRTLIARRTLYNIEGLDAYLREVSFRSFTPTITQVTP